MPNPRACQRFNKRGKACQSVQSAGKITWAKSYVSFCTWLAEKKATLRLCSDWLMLGVRDFYPSIFRSHSCLQCCYLFFTCRWITGADWKRSWLRLDFPWSAAGSHGLRASRNCWQTVSIVTSFPVENVRQNSDLNVLRKINFAWSCCFTTRFVEESNGRFKRWILTAFSQ